MSNHPHVAHKNAENEELFENGELLHISKREKLTAIYEVDLVQEIADITKYYQLLELLRDTEQEKQIVLYINNFGGSVFTGISIINAMRRCKFPILGVLDGMAASMAGIILMHCDKILVEPDSVLMIHHYSGVTYGKGQEMLSSIKSDEKVLKNLLRRTYKKLLTKEEFSDIFKGEDLYLSGKDLEKRLRKCKKLI